MRRRKQRGRDVHGILLLDKPAGITSNGALQKVKRLMYARKAGHTGSLDPIATGLLPICLGEATKMSSFLLNADKGYNVTIKLGVKTASGDTEGDIISERPVPEVSPVRLKEVLESFLGDIEQVPPMYSALKRDGQPLYKLARQGIEVEREPRPVTIHELVLLTQTKDTLDLSVLCSKGTYIRTLAEDIGEMLGCGAHVTVLRRTRVAGFDLKDAHTLEELEALKLQDYASLDAVLLPLDTAVLDRPQLSLTDDLVFYLRQGQPVFVPKAPSQGLVSLYGAQDAFVGVGHILDDGRVAPKRLLVL